MNSDTSALSALSYYSGAIFHRLRSNLSLFQNEIALLERESGKDLSALKARFTGMKDLISAASIPNNPGALKNFALQQISDLLLEVAPDGTTGAALVVNAEHSAIRIEGPRPVESSLGLQANSFTDLFCQQLGRESFRPPLIDGALKALGLSCKLEVNEKFVAVLEEQRA